MNAQLIADLINTVTDHRTKVTVGQVDALANALAANLKLAQQITDWIDRHHGRKAFPHLPMEEPQKEKPAEEQPEATETEE